nr:myeloid differentiation primary response protein MyD88 [Ciona intestinalis]|eukprot:XP_002121702.5 myeloid differentiation primary response protein MyD88 [Ciona intestinalis]
MSAPLSLQDQEKEFNKLANEQERARLESGESLHGGCDKLAAELDKKPENEGACGGASCLFPPPSYMQQSHASADPNPLGDISAKEDERNNVISYAVGMPRSDFCSTKLRHLRFDSRRQLGLHLDPERATVQNWKSLADLMGFSNLEILNFENERHKTRCVLEEYEVRQPSATIGNLCMMLDAIGRQDVLTDMEPWFARDSNMAVERSHSSMSSNFDLSPSRLLSSPTSLPIQQNAVTSSWNFGSTFPAQEKPPIDQGTADIQNKSYDAFLLYDAADSKFIREEFLPKVETDAKIKLFVPDRDLDAGVQAFQSQLEFMLRRCSKLVVILSDEFLKNPDSQWSLNVGVSLDPGSKGKKIIPVIYKKITEPNLLAGINPCNRTRVLEDSWFWNSVIRSLGGVQDNK